MIFEYDKEDTDDTFDRLDALKLEIEKKGKLIEKSKATHQELVDELQQRLVSYELQVTRILEIQDEKTKGNEVLSKLSETMNVIDAQTTKVIEHYKRLKDISSTYDTNKVTLKKAIAYVKSLDEETKQKTEATIKNLKTNIANSKEEITLRQKQNKAKLQSLQMQLKMTQSKKRSLKVELDQTKHQNTELVKICDDLIPHQK
uniref:Coiled-coil domain-containing protein 69-like n=1 Tax=Ciona intestinalis TaxID=7719 RepID=F6QN62_CIOIN|nr:coiled-coil domain-containing protein 69-like [Ciona intestinalis]|eukprot:XP_002127677.1 coiled-coil domain-containing protein 69-like [Ciona intestinalis]